jgi:predicted Zn-dependent protease
MADLINTTCTLSPKASMCRESQHMKLRVLFCLALSLSVSAFSVAQADQNISAGQQIAEPHGKKRIGGKDDITSIGHRKLGNKGFGNWYSLETDISIGKENAKLIEANVKLLQDPVVNEYVNRIGQNLVRNSDALIPFTFKVIDSDEVNAFSLPGGFLYVNCGLIVATDGEAELAGVMAHEIAHVAARHATRQMTRSNLFKLASLPLTFAGGGMAIQAAQMVTSLAMPMGMLKFSRGFEAEADYLGLEYLYAAGYDPQAFIAFLERAGSPEKKAGKLEGLLSTHPKTNGRIKKSQDEIARILPPRESYVVSTSEFDSVKTHLLAMQIPSEKSAQKSGEPTLRRNPVPSTSGEVGAQEDEKPPTLKRHDSQ